MSVKGKLTFTSDDEGEPLIVLKCGYCGKTVPNPEGSIVISVEDSLLGVFCSHECHNAAVKEARKEGRI